ncbi:MAG TPA: alpha/beta hydrolase [Dehalococcoidia bacterium]|jgi:pimeloyl-ACP methyl ester carboxylesterase|nr:alpha/beta hydrolase [Dehalococcoidia bacterium]
MAPRPWVQQLSRYVDDGINIHYVIEGQGEPVVFIHGWPEFWYGWRRQIPVLSERYQVIVPDLRGFGYSDKPLHGYDTKSAASDIYELVKQLGYQQISIVAHDIGVRVAYRFTLDHEEMVSRMVLLDSTPPMEQLGPQAPTVVRERWHSYFHQQFDLPEKLIEGREEAYLRHIFKDWTINKYPPSATEVAEYVRAYSQPGALRGGFSYYRAAAYEDPPHWQADADRVLQTPVLFLYGSRRINTAQASGAGPLDDAWRSVFPKVRGKDMGNYGHFLQWEAPDKVNEELISFLSE